MKYERWMAVADNHGDQQDDKAVAVALEFAKHWKPKHRLHLGDAFDFRSFRKNASQEESRESIKADIERGVEFLTAFKPTVFLRGNHDERAFDAALSDDGKVADFASYLVLDIKDALGPNCLMLPYHKRKGVHRLGDLACLHGYNAGVTATRMTGLVYGASLHGHTHEVTDVPIPGIERRVARGIGCLAQLDMPYNRAHVQTLRQAHGFAYGLLLTNKRTVTWQAKAEEDGTWYLPSEFREIRGDAKRH